MCPFPLAAYGSELTAQRGEGKGEGVSENILNLIIEVTVEKKKDKETKVATARDLWVPAVNNHGGFGKWTFLEITDPWNVKNIIRNFINIKGVSGLEFDYANEESFYCRPSV